MLKTAIELIQLDAAPFTLLLSGALLLQFLLNFSIDFHCQKFVLSHCFPICIPFLVSLCVNYMNLSMLEVRQRYGKDLEDFCMNIMYRIEFREVCETEK